ncbi:hypothetical protein Taro_020389 [Colocasia esculenta]|uniref:3-oxo-5-alpha-steroid 4-dehydrogenase C-terminal domain-containing protein n=1 Tax=Colocasia esculenta TaxID=4460 RepID=A0A843UW75_COLES|nr:hypothetical protein [Colocasia esculenta]
MELRLEVLLRLAWIAGTLPILVASLPISCLRRFRVRLSTFANRGKTSLSSSRILTVPHSYFLHFYIVAVLWTTYLLVSTWFYAYRKASPESMHHSIIASHLMGGSHLFSIHKSRHPNMEYSSQIWRTVFVLLLMEAQVFRRLYETVHVFSYNTSARMHIFGYLTGILHYCPIKDLICLLYLLASFYIAAPISLCSSIALEVLSYTVNQINEFVVKDRSRMPAVEFAFWEYLKPLMKLGWRQWIGAAIFLWGWIHQYHCHAILGTLRKQTGGEEYVVPHGDWFELVSCAHYLAEIVIYAGILMASGGLDATVWLLFAFVVTNLVFAAAETHRWYRHKFDSYPRNRKAVIPLIY